MLALQVVAGALLLAGSLAVVAFLRWLETQEPQAEAARLVAVRGVAPAAPVAPRRRTLRPAA